jgi:uncharacterized protein
MSKLVVLDERRQPAPRRSIRASRYAHLVPLPEGGAVVWNSLSGDLSLWSTAEAASFQQFQATGEFDSDDRFLDRVWRSRNIVERDLEEVEIVRSIYDQARYGHPVLTLSHFVRGPLSGPPQAPMSQAVRGGITALCDRMAGSLRQHHSLWAGHEPLHALYEVGDLSLRLAEISANRGIRYSGAVQTDGVALTPAIAEKLPDLEIKHVELALRTGAGVLDTLGLVIENVSAALDTGRLEVHARFEAAPQRPGAAMQVVEALAAAGFASRKGFRLDFAGGVFETCHRELGLSAAGGRGTAIIERALRLGFEASPALPRFLGQCQAVRSYAYVVAANGDMYKCWSSLGDSEARIGNVTQPASYNVPLAKRPRWMIADPFSDPVCGDCSILPLCTGHCADLFSAKHAGRERPCPDVKFELQDRILAAARIAGILP